MAGTTFLATISIDTLAHFQTWAQTFSGLMNSAGWVQTSDTGQVNWGSLVSPPGTNASVYEVWRMNDANQTACPVVMRIDYINNNNSSAAFKFTVGQASNGLGTIVNPAVAIQTLTAGQAYSPGVSTLEQCHFNGANNWMGTIMWRTSGSDHGPFFFSVERSKDSNGNDTADYVVILYAGYSVTYQQTMFKPGMGGNPTGEPNGSWVILMSGNSTTGFGNNVGCSPVFPWVGKADNPLVNTIIGDNSYGEALTTSLTLYGTSRSYFMTGAQNIGYLTASRNSGGNSLRKVGLRWD